MSKTTDTCAIRPLRPGDLPSAVELFMMTSASDIRHRLTSRMTATEPGQVNFGLVADRGGTVVGAAKLTTEPAFPGTVSALVAVAGTARGQGIGTALANRLDDRFGLLSGVQTVTCALRDDLGQGREFAERYGFAVTNHSVGFRLELPAPHDGPAGRTSDEPRAPQVRIRTAHLDTDGYAIVDCVRRSLAGLPMPFGEEQAFDPEQGRRMIPGNALIVLAEPIGQPIAEPARACGVTILAPERGSSGTWHILYTGVDPHHRGHGVAAALKGASIRMAHRAGARSITTDNDESNLPILRLNRKLGMKPSVGYWGLARPLAR